MNERVGVHLSRREEVTLDLFGIMLLFSFERWINNTTDASHWDLATRRAYGSGRPKSSFSGPLYFLPTANRQVVGAGLSLASGGFALSNVHVLQFANCLSVLLLSQLGTSQGGSCRPVVCIKSGPFLSRMDEG